MIQDMPKTLIISAKYCSDIGGLISDQFHKRSVQIFGRAMLRLVKLWNAKQSRKETIISAEFRASTEKPQALGWEKCDDFLTYQPI